MIVDPSAMTCTWPTTGSFPPVLPAGKSVPACAQPVAPAGARILDRVAFATQAGRVRPRGVRRAGAVHRDGRGAKPHRFGDFDRSAADRQRVCREREHGGGGEHADQRGATDAVRITPIIFPISRACQWMRNMASPIYLFVDTRRRRSLPLPVSASIHPALQQLHLAAQSLDLRPVIVGAQDRADVPMEVRRGQDQRIGHPQREHACPATPRRAPRLACRGAGDP